MKNFKKTNKIDFKLSIIKLKSEIFRSNKKEYLIFSISSHLARMNKVD